MMRGDLRLNIGPRQTDDCVEDVIGRYSVMVYRLAYSRTVSRSDADDIYQEVFLRYIRKSPVFESEEHRKAWLIRVTVNCSNKQLSSAWARKTVPLDDTFSFETKEETSLQDTLKTLPPKYRTVIHLFYYEDLSVEQISNILGEKQSTVRTQLTRARAMLRESLKGE
jgi:RNA polymerase sigma-70 factor (ECF subfamily)